MQIKDGFEIEDKVSGLRITVVRGVTLDRLHIEIVGRPIANNRDFFFTRDGEFDGTGSEFRDCESAPAAPPAAPQEKKADMQSDLAATYGRKPDSEVNASGKAAPALDNPAVAAGLTREKIERIRICFRMFSEDDEQKYRLDAICDLALRAFEGPSEEEIAQAVARGWCDPANSYKQMDAILAASITREVCAVARKVPRRGETCSTYHSE